MPARDLWAVVDFQWIAGWLGLLEVRALALAAKSHPPTYLPFAETPMRLLIAERFLFDEQRATDDFVADLIEYEEDRAREAHEDHLRETQYR